MEKKENENRFKETRLEEGGLEEVGWKGWTCLEAKKVLGYEIGGMRVGGGRLEMVGAEKGGIIRRLEKKEQEIISGKKVGGRRVGSGWGGGLDMLGG